MSLERWIVPGLITAGIASCAGGLLSLSGAAYLFYGRKSPGADYVY